MFKKNTTRSGNGLKTPKFHQMFHLIDHVNLHGCSMDYDGSRGESLGKFMIKDDAQLTNKAKDTLNFDIGRRLSEEDVVDQVSSAHFQNEGMWPSKFCSNQDMTRTVVVDIGEEIGTISNSKPRFFYQIFFRNK